MTAAASPQNLDIAHLRSWIGREEITSDLLSVDLVRKFKATFDLSDGNLSHGVAAPRLIHYCLGQPAAPTSGLGPDGHPVKGSFLPPVPLPRRMWASSSLTFHYDLHVGDEIRRVSRIAGVEVKEGRSGLLCFVVVEHRLDVAGRLAIEERQDIVYRPAASALVPGAERPPASDQAATPGQFSKRVKCSTPLLFRYSALTFNGHRIHFDRRYAVEVEHYPGLVVHGPLQATLLLQYAEQLKRRTCARFSFRGQSPLFDDDDIHLHAADEGDRIRLWTARANGPVGMIAEAVWS